MNKSIKGFFSYSVGRLRTDTPRTVFIAAYIMFTLYSSVYFAILGRVRDALLPIGYAALFVVLLFAFEYFMRANCPLPFILVLFSVPIGGILGSCYDFYTFIPFFDSVLHTVSGFIFAAVGYALMEIILNKNDTRSRLAMLLFAFAFSLAIAVLWEMFEWALTSITSGDMQEDGLVHSIHSYLLSGSHSSTFDITMIEGTVIIYDGGKEYYINGGYMDLGLFDTLLDMLVCLFGACAFLLLGLVERKAKKQILKPFVPHVLESNDP
ncbi:MAG: DUF2238 domain-containing protein [Clostridia bacterium]|nr:DUF2238 domain-containing protein [Clostridia bacterium]